MTKTDIIRQWANKNKVEVLCLKLSYDPEYESAYKVIALPEEVIQAKKILREFYEKNNIWYDPYYL